MGSSYPGRHGRREVSTLQVLDLMEPLLDSRGDRVLGKLLCRLGEELPVRLEEEPLVRRWNESSHDEAIQHDQQRCEDRLPVRVLLSTDRNGNRKLGLNDPLADTAKMVTGD